ncbi:Rhodanese-like/PpiC domain-containing protein 12, chloroplastic isoform E [Glycine soja]|uniref:Rhodanese-like/PpiC domain-containing protein 12, chloroplastic isoform E n=1 Tax=Glycine soja TaxID=3848 RepID=A0A445H121_GLYSO|nr:Rhodanese-like/PpiC domain-containing protein 12, chloroplastic isoform E [Glycine soja]
MKCETNVCIVSARQIAIAAMSILRSVCQLRVGVTTPKPCLHPSIFLFSLSLSHNTHTLTSFPRTFRFHPLSLPLSPFVLFMPPKATASYGTGASGAAEGDRPREILVQHLLVKEDDQKLLLYLQQKISSGEDLSDLAVEYSLCPSKEEGGMLGWVRKGQMVPEFEEAAFTAPLNQVVRCKTKFGWHLLQVLSEREESILQDIQPDELHMKIQDPSFLDEAQLIDVREPDEVAKASLPGFTVLPLRQFGSWGPEITTKFDPQKDTYVMCHHGMRSLQVAKWLQSQGFRKVYNLSGGIHAYAVQMLHVMPIFSSPRLVPFSCY